MEFPQNYFCAEVRDDFEIPAMMKRAWAAELEVLSVIADVCERYHLQYFADYGTSAWRGAPQGIHTVG